MYMIEGDLRLERQGNALIVHSKHNARWFGALVGGFALFFFFRWISMPNQGGLPLLGYWFGVVIGVMFLGIGIFLSLPREVTTTFDLRSRSRRDGRRRRCHLLSLGACLQTLR